MRINHWLVGVLTVGMTVACLGAEASESVPFDGFASSPVENSNTVRDRVSDGFLSRAIRSQFVDHRPYLFAGTEFSFLEVDASSGGQVTLSVNDTDTVGTDLALLDGNGVDTTAYAPRLWVGVQLLEKWAVVGRYWRLSESTSGIPDAAPGSANLSHFLTLDDSSEVDAYTIDVEAVRSFSPGRWKIDAMLGGRNASYSADSEVRAFGVFTAGNFVNLALSNGSAFDGAGVTYGLAARRQLFHSHTSFFVSCRGSQLDGESDSFGRAVGSVAVSPNPPLLGAATVTRNNAEASLETVECQIGLQWDYELRCLPAACFLRTAYEYQYWDIEGPPTGGAGFGGTIADVQTASFAQAGLGNLKLSGFSISTGLTW